LAGTRASSAAITTGRLDARGGCVLGVIGTLLVTELPAIVIAPRIRNPRAHLGHFGRSFPM
jgi:hypothetical protein